MDFPDFARLYESYTAEYLAPSLPVIDRLFNEWKSKEFWVPARPADDPVIPTPVYNAYRRVKRAGSTWDKLSRVASNESDMTFDTLDRLDDLLGVRAVIYLSNYYPAIHSALARSKYVEINPDYPPRCYLPESMINRLGMPSEEFELSDIKPSGYGSIHYTLRFKESTGLRLKRFEFQVRTILLEAWGEIEHKLNYKSSVENEVGVRRQLRVVADSLRTVDEYFEIIHERSRYLRALNQTTGSTMDSDVLDDARLARLLAQYEVPVSESELGKLRRILSSHHINSVGDFRALTGGQTVSWIREELGIYVPGQHLDPYTLVAVIVLLHSKPTREDVKNAMGATMREAEMTHSVSSRLFKPYRS
ncbi:hypothetical protein [Mycobacteroides abscessus]|uniref:hypothetical protein n=1 Tax=Mycobacteroides abscessus TaxID=36809 RepID=UPI00130011D8|nr:hypothetical protein [Mycobacteroides abscessus]